MVKLLRSKYQDFSFARALGRCTTPTPIAKLREQEKSETVAAILADRDATIEQIRTQRDVIKQALSEAFELRKTGFKLKSMPWTKL